MKTVDFLINLLTILIQVPLSAAVSYKPRKADIVIIIIGSISVFALVGVVLWLTVQGKY